MDNWIKELSLVLNETDRKILEESQIQWEESLTTSMDADYSILTNSEDYGIDMGQYFKVLHLSETRESYRERTIHIKYLYYLYNKAQ